MDTCYAMVGYQWTLVTLWSGLLVYILFLNLLISVIIPQLVKLSLPPSFPGFRSLQANLTFRGLIVVYNDHRSTHVNVFCVSQDLARYLKCRAGLRSTKETENFIYVILTGPHNVKDPRTHSLQGDGASGDTHPPRRA